MGYTANNQAYMGDQETDTNPSPLAEQWPYLRFLGLAAWWAWIWLCYFSTSLVGLFPTEDRPYLVYQMYLISTTTIALTMVLAAIFYKRVARLLDSTKAILAAAFLAGGATFVLAYSAAWNMTPIFPLAAAITGAGTGALCLKVGRLYGTVGLSDSLTAGAISLVLAAMLYFVGLGIPAQWTIFYLASLPLLASVLLCLPSHDPYEASAVDNNTARKPSQRVRSLYVRLVAAAGIVAATAGIARGIASNSQIAGNYEWEGSLIVCGIGIIGLILTYVVNRMAVHRKGARMVYVGLMVMGIGLMLATSFGLSISFLSIGKETLWLVLSCLMAFMAFRFDLPSVRVFALGQAAYFFSSVAAWAIGAALAPLYADPVIRMAVGASMAFVVVLVMTLIFTEQDIKAIVLTPVLRKAQVVHPLQDASEAQTPAMQPLRADEGHDAPTGHVPVLSESNGDVYPLGTQPVQGQAPGQSQSQPPAPSPAHEDTLRLTMLETRFGLSAREVEIMDLFAQGRSANWIADALYISQNTVRSHLRAIYTKLDVHTRQELLDRLNSLSEE